MNTDSAQYRRAFTKTLRTMYYGNRSHVVSAKINERLYTALKNRIYSGEYGTMNDIVEEALFNLEWNKEWKKIKNDGGFNLGQ